MRELTDNVLINDAIAQEVLFMRELTDNVPINDAIAQEVLFMRELTDNVLINDAIAQEVLFMRELTDNVPINDAIAQEVLFMRELTDNVPINDAIEREVLFMRELTDNVPLADEIDIKKLTKIARTQGFWSTHVDFAEDVWESLSVNLKTIGGNTLTFEEMMGGFWAKIPKETDNTKRSNVEQAQMQMLQQLLATILNSKFCGGCTVFDPVTTTDLTIFELIDAAKTEFNDGTVANIPDILRFAELLAELNENPAFNVEFPVTVPPADPKFAKNTVADIMFWDDGGMGGSLPP